MRLITRLSGLDPRLSAALRSRAFNTADTSALRDEYSVLALSNKGHARPDTEASFAALIPFHEVKDLQGMGLIKPGLLIQRCLRVIVIPHNDDLPTFETTKFLDFMNVVTNEIVKRELALDNAEFFGYVIAQYLFNNTVPPEERKPNASP